MAAKEEEQSDAISVPSCLHMVSAFLAMEPTDAVISFARELGGGYITETVQSCIWHQCIKGADVKVKGTYLRRFLKKLILEIESSGGDVLDELYEQCASYMISLKDCDENEGSSRILKTMSFLFPNDESCGILTAPKSRKLEVHLQCSLNMLEGDTGCSIWPSSLFLSEFILSYPEIFTDKCCFEVGSGVGLVGICLAHVRASKVILSDGDLSTLANMKVNLELNHLSSGNLTLENAVHHDMVDCVCLPWESASRDDLCGFSADIVLGADVIYDPSCIPHLVQVLSVLLNRENSHTEVITRNEFDSSQGKSPVAYVASVIRNIQTFKYFLDVAKESKLIVADITGNVHVSDFLPYLRSYNRSSIRLLRIHS